MKTCNDRIFSDIALCHFSTIPNYIGDLFTCYEFKKDLDYVPTNTICDVNQEYICLYFQHF